MLVYRLLFHADMLIFLRDIFQNENCVRRGKKFEQNGTDLQQKLDIEDQKGFFLMIKLHNF